jgi:hypothetical protein
LPIQHVVNKKRSAENIQKQVFQIIYVKRYLIKHLTCITGGVRKELATQSEYSVIHEVSSTYKSK